MSNPLLHTLFQQMQIYSFQQSQNVRVIRVIMSEQWYKACQSCGSEARSNASCLLIENSDSLLPAYIQQSHIHCDQQSHIHCYQRSQVRPHQWSLIHRYLLAFSEASFTLTSKAIFTPSSKAISTGTSEPSFTPSSEVSFPSTTSAKCKMVWKL